MSTIKIAYITSSSYSGSTLLSLILNAHPDIGTISEFDALGNMTRDPDFACSCGEPIDTCPFFVRLRDAIAEKGVPFEIRNMDMLLRLSDNERVNALLTAKVPLLNANWVETVRDRLVDWIPTYRRENNRMYARNDALMHAVLDLQGANLYLDATKNPHRMLFLSRRYDVKALYIFKNGIAGVYSYLKAARRRNKARTVEEATHRWFREQIIITRCLKKLGRENAMQMAYSDLCRDTEQVIRNTCAFLGLDPVALQNFAKAEHHVVGNAMRLGDFSEIRERTDWKDKLTTEELDRYRRIASDYLPRLEACNPALAACIWI